QVAFPQLVPPGAITNNDLVASFSCETIGAQLHYTTDGSTPSLSSPGITAGTPFVLTQSCQVKVIGYKMGYTPSGVISNDVVLKVAAPALLHPGSLNLDNDFTVTITNATLNAQMYWTTNGTPPTTNGNLYTAPILISNACTLEVIAVRAG